MAHDEPYREVYETTYSEYNDFMQEAVEAGLVDTFFEDIHASDEHGETQEIDDTLRTTEVRYIFNALIHAHNAAAAQGEFLDALMYHQLIKRVRGWNERLEAEHEQTIEQMEKMREQDPFDGELDGGLGSLM